MARQPSSGLYLSSNEQDLLVAALNSNQPNSVLPPRADSQNGTYTPPNMSTNPGSGQLDYSDDSPYLDFDQDGDFDDFSFDANGRMIGDLPDSGDLHEKRKSVDGKDDDDEGGGKRREGEDKVSKKPGRKPLMNEPTSKRKAQNRAAQRAFRERKEKHLKDLETKVDDLEKASEATNHENGLLKAQVDRLQVELKEYRKRLSWISNNGIGRSNSQSSGNQQKSSTANNQGNDFQFEFPKFGDLPPMAATNLFNDQITSKAQNPTSSSGNKTTTTNSSNKRSASTPNPNMRSGSVPGPHSGLRSNSQGQSQRPSQSPTNTQTPAGRSVDSLTGLFSPSILEASRQNGLGYFPHQNYNHNVTGRGSMDNARNGVYTNSTTSNSDSPGSSTESQNAVSSIGTSPEPSLNSPGNKLQEYNLNTINEEQIQNPSNQFGKDELCRELSSTCGCPEDPIPPILRNGLSDEDSSLGYDFNSNNPAFDTNFNIFAQQNLPNGAFDPILFGDYRETQDNILSQDFGSFFNDAYPLPDLGSPSHNISDAVSDGVQPAPTQTKTDLLSRVESAQEAEEVVPNTDKPMTCNKIWDRLQSMEKFRNGEIDIDNLCSELRAKAKCSEGGAVVDKQDVDKILGGNRFT